MVTHLIVGLGASGLGVWARVSTTGLFVDVGARLKVGVTLRQHIRLSVERNSHNHFVGGAAVINPQLDSVILKLKF